MEGKYTESILKAGLLTVSEKIVDTVWLPELPVTVKLYSPRGVEELACKVNVLEPF
jgi:hypothetical protein